MAINIKQNELGKVYNLMASGGEAEIYEYTKYEVMKIFKTNVIFDLKEKKVLAWLKPHRLFFVIAPLNNVIIANRFAGYIMRKVTNSEQIGALAKKKHLKLTGFTNKDILEIMIDYSDKLEQIHKDGKYIGDINERNVLVKGKDLYFIDADSFGIDSHPADAWTENYVDPEAYIYNKGNLVKVELSVKTDMYAFALLCFKILTRMHPFNGKYDKDVDMSTENRIKAKLSVLGNHNIGIPPMIDSWNWMSPRLLDSFLAIFEKGERKYITEDLRDLYNNLKYCNKHKVYYYSKYTECPICNEKADVSVMPSVTKAVTPSGISIKTIFASKEVNYFFDFDKYLNYDSKFVHVRTGKTWGASNDYRVEFSEDGKYVFEIYDNEIVVYDTDTNNRVCHMQKSYKSAVSISGKCICYIDDSFRLSKNEIKNGMLFFEELASVYVNTIYLVTNDDYLAILLYDKKMLITSKKFSVFLNYKNKITEYAIKYDKISKNWLFIYETSTGTHRTVVISLKGEIIFDKEVYRYSATSLNSICFANNTIFSPSHGKIVGINYLENRVKNFDCHVVNEDATLNFENGGFDILTDKAIYRFG